MAYQIKDTEDLQSQLTAAGDKLVVLRVWRIFIESRGSMASLL